MRSLVSSALALVLAGCAYQPGSFRRDAPFPGVHATVACLDVAIDRRADLTCAWLRAAAWSGGSGACDVASDQAVVAYAFGNRCDHATLVDLADVSVVARDARGDALALRPFDPRRELVALSLDGRATGREAIAYDGAAPGDVVCVDVASIAHASPAQWRCFPPTADASLVSSRSSEEVP